MKIAVAMSGGVDSSVAAAIAVEKYGAENVFGVTMKLFCYGDDEGSQKSCCSLDAINDAAAVCKQLGINHYILDLEKEFKEAVIDDFILGYKSGKTPNPCIKCNQIIKFEVLLDRVRGIGADILATGHYARIVNIKSEYFLEKGEDNTKDQTYFLYNIKKEELPYIWFPVGDMKKTATRAYAESINLKTAQKTESQDICFVRTSTAEFISEKVRLVPGDIVSTEGVIIGKHRGLPLYTIGQRKGLGGGFTETMYVVKLNFSNNTLTVGNKNDLYGGEMFLDSIHWLSEPTLFPVKTRVKIRYNSPEIGCIISKISEGYSVTFEQPQLAVTPGQSAVFYDDNLVLGGGIIASTR